jgi:PKD repeat protein
MHKFVSTVDIVPSRRTEIQVSSIYKWIHKRERKKVRRLILCLATLLLILFIISVSTMFPLAIARKPPKIVSITKSPETPNYDQSVTVTAQVIRKGHPIESVILRYSLNFGSWNEVVMSLEYGVYVAEIPAQPYDTQVIYNVYAYNTHGQYSRSDYYSYVVDDFVPPVISNILYAHASPMPFEKVTVSASVTEPPEASGVKSVILRYKIDDDEWSGIEMTMHEGLWNTIIPGQSGGVTVKFFIKSYDNARNCVTTPIFDYCVLVPNELPVAFFTESAETVYTDEVIYFDASESYDKDGKIVSYHWEFGDGGTETCVTTEHAYSEDGEYPVTLTVTDDNGATDIASANKTVLNQEPVASFTESAETVFIDEVISFNASGSYDPDGSIKSYYWDFGDGNTGTGVMIEHSYSQEGTNTVTLTVTDDDGAKDTADATKTVLTQPPINQEPVASFTESAETVFTGEAIQFNASDSYDPDATIASYSWNFGDGSTESGVTVSHSYLDDGTYTVTLTVTDNEEATDTAQATKTVLNRQPVAFFTEPEEKVYTCVAIDFDASGSHDPDGTIIGYLWDFGDDNTAVGIEVDHAYQDDGAYIVTLTVIDDDGAAGTSTSTKHIFNIPPIAAFTDNATTVNTGEVIRFDASDSYDPDGTIVSYEWGFGDGSTATGMTTDHVYSEVGDYAVNLVVTDDDGDSSTETAEKIVEGEETSNDVLSLSFIAAVGLGIAALTWTLLYGLLRRRKKKKRTEGQSA